jgi:hypothetical protein
MAENNLSLTKTLPVGYSDSKLLRDGEVEYKELNNNPKLNRLGRISCMHCQNASPSMQGVTERETIQRKKRSSGGIHLIAQGSFPCQGQ